MTNHTHYHICKRHLRKGGIWCVFCKAYIHVSYSGVQSSNIYYDGFSCIQCTPNNFTKEPDSTNRPTSTAPITTQKETSLATPTTNVLPNAIQPYHRYIVEIPCPALHHALANSYKHPSNLYVNYTVTYN